MTEFGVYRRVLVWGGWGLVLAAGLCGLFVWDSYHAYSVAIRDFERRVGPAEHAEYVRRPVPDESNAAVSFPLAMNGVELDPRWSRALEPAGWTREDAAVAREALAQTRQALAGLEAAAELVDCVWPSIPGKAVEWSLASVRAARLLRLSGFAGVALGDAAQVERSFRVLGELADCLYAQPNLTGTLVATAVSRARLEVVRAAVASPETGSDLLETFAEELERSLEADRVDWAIAAEGAFGLHFIENPHLAGVAPRGGSVYPVFARRVAAEFSNRWVGLRDWSEKPLDEMLSEAVTKPEKRSTTAVIADILMPNVRDAVVKMRILEELTRLGLVAIEGRRRGLALGNYDDALVEHPALGTIAEGDGAIVILDSDLETLLRQRYIGLGSDPSPGTETTLQLTVWRLPPPAS